MILHHVPLLNYRKQLRNAATRTFHDPNAIYSELILWRVDHIGPLSCTGGVSELARINSLHTSAFSNVAWLPTLVPSSVLGRYTASDLYGQRLQRKVAKRADKYRFCGKKIAVMIEKYVK